MKFTALFVLASSIGFGSAFAAPPAKLAVMKRAADDSKVYDKLPITLTNGKTLVAHDMSPAEAAEAVTLCCVVRDSRIVTTSRMLVDLTVFDHVMHTPTRYLVVAVTVLIGLHFILSISHEGYGKATSLDNIKGKLKSPLYPPSGSDEYYDKIAGRNSTRRKANAAFVILARNGDLSGVIESIKQNEDRFNKEYGYPYVFLNEEPFSPDFVKYTSEVVSTRTEYGLIPRDHWHQPSWIDETKAAAARKSMGDRGVIYGESLPYRNMCRFNSGFFWRNELLKKYDYYWRIEPSVKFYCDMLHDPFLFMQDNKKVYGFTISLPEYGETIETLWDTTKAFMKENPHLMPKDNALKFLSDDGGETYNRCHFWSNFEIGDLNFWRGTAYTEYFDYLDKAGGFYYERWGDAPVHSIGAALFARKDQIHFFNDVGYRHEPFMHCPTGEVHSKGKCWCDQNQNFDYKGYSCLKKFEGA